MQALKLGLVYGKDYYGNIIQELTICSLKHETIPHSFEISMLLFFVAPMSVITVLYVLIGMKLYKPNIPTSVKRNQILISATIREIGHQHIIHSNPSLHINHSKSTKRVIKMLGKKNLILIFKISSTKINICFH